jgi:hypothetical protein
VQRGGCLPDSDAARVEELCVPFAAGRDYTAFTRKLRREVLALDSRTVEERWRAAVEDRRVWCQASSDSATATFGAALPADDAQTLVAAIDEAADRIPKADSRTRDQRRADGLAQIARDWLAGAASNGTHIGPAVQVVVAASTLLGLEPAR